MTVLIPIRGAYFGSKDALSLQSKRMHIAQGIDAPQEEIIIAEIPAKTKMRVADAKIIYLEIAIRVTRTNLAKDLSNKLWKVMEKMINHDNYDQSIIRCISASTDAIKIKSTNYHIYHIAEISAKFLFLLQKSYRFGHFDRF